MPAAQRNFPYNRKPSDFNQADWLARHTTLLNEHRDRWIQSGYDVRVESQNAFQLRGHSAILAGKPDLLVLNKNRILITDSKTGQEQPWHKFQVMTYMYALPMALPEYRDFKFAGEIVYNDRTERVPQGGIDQGFVRNLGSLIRRIAAPEPPVRLPNCRIYEQVRSPRKPHEVVRRQNVDAPRVSNDSITTLRPDPMQLSNGHSVHIQSADVIRRHLRRFPTSGPHDEHQAEPCQYELLSHAYSEAMRAKLALQTRSPTGFTHHGKHLPRTDLEDPIILWLHNNLFPPGLSQIIQRHHAPPRKVDVFAL